MSQARKDAQKRNWLFGNLHLARKQITKMLESDVVSETEKIELRFAKAYIVKAISKWDKHYIKGRVENED